MCRKVESNYSRSLWMVGLLILGLASNQASGIGCLDAVTRLIPCQPFLLGMSSTVTVPCCEGASSLDKLIEANRGEIKGLCECLKQAAASMRVNVDRAKQLPQLCKITVPIPIDPNVNCDAY